MAKNLQSAITPNKFSPDYQLIILYYLANFDAHSCYSFQDILITKYHYDNLKGA